MRRIDTERSEPHAGVQPVSDTFDPDAFDPHDPAFLADPYPTYALFRDRAPVHLVKPYDACWVFRYEDCVRVLGETDVWVKNPPGGEPPAPGPFAMTSVFPEGLFVADPPLHTQLRELLEPVFEHSIDGARERARQIAAPLLQAARKKGSLELVSDYALPLPAGVLFSLLGIPEGAYGQDIWKGLIAWQASIAAAHNIAEPIAVRAAGATCSMALDWFFEGMLLTRAKSSASVPDGLVTEMSGALLEAGLSTQQVQVCASDLLVAGYLSTTFIIGLGVRNLLLHPDQLEKLRANPSLVDSAFEEMLRFDGSVHIVDRCAGRPTELGGRTFAPGEKISLNLGSANRDPDGFAEPDRFDIERGQTAHLAFGEGIHTCIGAPLARIVAPVALEMLLAEFTELTLEAAPQWQTDPYLRAMTSLPLRF
ncbi:MAG TPA: cytochrome P450 [Solirubrobacteraceae bacterium]|nr:cytochrome P450 [Solirubrobacteraceae bacterium]